MKISELPLEEQPRIKAKFHGVESLSDGELLALLIGSGTRGKSALEIGNGLIKSYQNIRLLSNENHKNLTKHKGISTIVALKLCACFELSKRIMNTSSNYLKVIKSPADLFETYSYIGLANTENACLVMLSKRGKILKERQIDGSYTSSVVISAKEIINEILMSNADLVALIHNHPSGELIPSSADNLATQGLIEVLKQVGARLYDHIIVNDIDYYSYKEHQDIEKTITKGKKL